MTFNGCIAEFGEKLSFYRNELIFLKLVLLWIRRANFFLISIHTLEVCFFPHMLHVDYFTLSCQ